MSNTEKQLPLRIECIQGILSVKDMQISRAFYTELLGFTEADWGTDEFTSMNRDGAGLYLCRGAQGQAGTWLWVGFDGDIYQLQHQLLGKGVKIRQAPVNYSWALELHIEDPDGHVLRFATSPDPGQPFLDQPVDGKSPGDPKG